MGYNYCRGGFFCIECKYSPKAARCGGNCYARRSCSFCYSMITSVIPVASAVDGGLQKTSCFEYPCISYHEQAWAIFVFFIPKWAFVRRIWLQKGNYLFPRSKMLQPVCLTGCLFGERVSRALLPGKF